MKKQKRWTVVARMVYDTAKSVKASDEAEATAKAIIYFSKKFPGAGIIPQLTKEVKQEAKKKGRDSQR